MDTKITPLPWRYVRENGSPTTGQHMISGAKPGYLAEVRDCGSGDVEANAAFIVKAVNSHKQLKACLELCLERIIAECADPDHLEEVILARAALARLEGK